MQGAAMEFELDEEGINSMRTKMASKLLGGFWYASISYCIWTLPKHLPIGLLNLLRN